MLCKFLLHKKVSQNYLLKLLQNRDKNNRIYYCNKYIYKMLRSPFRSLKILSPRKLLF